MSRNAAALDLPYLRAVVEEIGPREPFFVAVSGAHLYGFPSPESDIDLRGAHVIPLRELVGLRPPRETRKKARSGSPYVDYVSHDVGKFVRLLVGKNGYALEQVLSPEVVYARPGFERLQELARASLNRSLYHHYRGWAHGRWSQFASEEPKRVKTLLSVYRVLLTGTHLLQHGDVESNLPRLASARGLDAVPELVERKRRGEEPPLEREDVERHAQLVSGLEADLRRAYDASSLPETAPNLAEIEEFLIELRLEELGRGDSAGAH